MSVQTAFQADAFQNDAFQIGDAVVVSPGGGVSRVGLVWRNAPRREIDEVFYTAAELMAQALDETEAAPVMIAIDLEDGLSRTKEAAAILGAAIESTSKTT